MSRRSIHQGVKLHSQRTGNKSIKITLIEDQPEHGFTWSKYGSEYGKSVGKQLQKYCCTQCRSIYDKKKKNAEDTDPIPCLIFNVEEDRFESEIENHGHYCNPQHLNVIRGKEVRRNELAKIKHTRDKPAAAHVKLAESITQRFGQRAEEVQLEIAQHAAPSKTGFSKAATRVVNSLHPKIKTIPELEDPKNSKFKLTFGGEVRQNPDEKYVLWNDNDNIIFGSPFYITLFLMALEIFLDGTFKYRAVGFDQCYRIFALVNETVVVPVFTILMKGKSTESYTNVFTAISNLVNNAPIAAVYAHFDCEIYSKKKSDKCSLGCFMYEDRLLQNCMELDAKLKLSGRREAPVKDRSGDLKIANHRAKLLENLQLNAAVSRSDEIWKRLYHLGKAAGNN